MGEKIRWFGWGFGWGMVIFSTVEYVIYHDWTVLFGGW